MKQIALLLMLISAIGLLAALQCVAADGAEIQMDSREFHYRYHTSTNDFLFFGANKWAVRFNFRNAYPSLSTVNFEVQGARLWFPNPGDSVTVELLADLDGQPGQSLRTKRVPINESLVDIYFDESHTAQQIWLMVSYNTNMSNSWVAASRLGGNNSYYMNEVGDVQILSSFASAGYNCELLFGLLGDFPLSEPDLQLYSFDLVGDMLPGSRVIPGFSVYNHSAQSIANASLELVLSKPGLPAYETHNIDIQEPIPPFTMMDFGFDTPWLTNLDLPDSPTQLRIEATLSSELSENDTLLVNNQLNKAYSIFEEEMPILLIENFLRIDETGVITTLQDPLLEEKHHRLQYYPMLSDSLSNLPSQRRFNWYQFNSVPRTVGMGHAQVTGFRDDYPILFEQVIDSIEDSRTFVSSSTCTASAQEGTESIQVDIGLQNQNTSLYTAVGQSIMSGSRFFVALARKHALEGSEHFVLERFVSFADTINVALNAGSTINKSYSFTISGISSGELVDNYRLYYWLQGNSGGRIHYANFAGFRPETFVGISDAVLAPPRLELYPNPLRKGNELTLRNKTASRGSLSIYNLKGQLIYRETEFKGELKLKDSHFPASGIYFLRYEDGEGQAQTKKLSIVK
jgi:hypothetical protein